MLLSIVILSYNRPKQIERILKHFSTVKNQEFNIIIKDDVSPKINEIEEIYNKYKKSLQVKVELHKNTFNLGYDRNLLNAFDITDSEYVFLLSDDDYIDGDEIESLISTLSKREEKFYFTPYTDKKDGITNRICNQKSDKDISNSDFSSIIYNSILFSGLIYHKDTVLNLDLDREFLFDCIYSQVYLASVIIYNTKSYGVIPSGVLYLGGDGDNFFGKNESAKNIELLSDRTKLTSNLNYQPFLLLVVDKISEDTSSNIKKVFLKEYKKRLISYALRVRTYGVKSYLRFIKVYLSSDLPFFMFIFVVFLFICIIPRKIADYINRVGLTMTRHSG